MINIKGNILPGKKCFSPVRTRWMTEWKYELYGVDTLDTIVIVFDSSRSLSNLLRLTNSHLRYTSPTSHIFLHYCALKLRNLNSLPHEHMVAAKLKNTGGSRFLEFNIHRKQKLRSPSSEDVTATAVLPPSFYLCR
ncbi:hypothetical protein YC2023_077032 [Brassica napus]